MAALDALQSTTGLVRENGGREPPLLARSLAHSLAPFLQPWWAALATGGAAVRLGLYPVTRKGQQATSVVVSAFREAQRQVSDDDDAKKQNRNERAEVLRRAREMIAARATEASSSSSSSLSSLSPVSPLWMVVAPLAQVSVLVYGLYSVRYMAKSGYEGLASGGPSWAVGIDLDV